jgi:predicted cobalt transporter CbtA
MSDGSRRSGETGAWSIVAVTSLATLLTYLLPYAVTSVAVYEQIFWGAAAVMLAGTLMAFAIGLAPSPSSAVEASLKKFSALPRKICHGEGPFSLMLARMTMVRPRDLAM